MIKKIQAYAYLGTETKQVKCNIVADDVIYNKLQAIYEGGAPSNSIIQRWQDLETTEAPKLVNDYFGAHILGEHGDSPLDFYLALLSGESPDTSIVTILSGLCGVSPTFYREQTTRDISKFITLDNVDIAQNVSNLKMGSVQIYTPQMEYNLKCESVYDNELTIDTLYDYVEVDFHVYPEDILTGNSVDCTKYIADSTARCFSVRIRFNCDSTNGYVEEIIVRYNVNPRTMWETIEHVYSGVNVDTPGNTEEDIENPYGYEGTSGPGGGNGKYGDIDGIEATDIPDLPTVNAASLGLITLYNPSAATVNSLASYLWSGMFDPTSFKKLFADPMGCMIGLSIVPAIPSTGGSKNIRFGNVDTGINCSYLSSNYCNVDCGSVAVDEYVGSFLDYEPHVKLNLFLPYVGFVPLSADDIVGGSINVQYNVDVLSGHCVAFVKHSTKGVLYSYSGSCITNIPLTAQSFSQALQSYYSALAGVAGSAAGSLGSGGAGLVSLAGQMASTAMNTAFNMHPNFQRSGGMGGAAAIMGVQTPFIVIQRPRFSVPMSVTHYAGLTSNMTRSLGECSGFTLVEYVHLHGITATSEELLEIESMLKAGVIL